MDTDGSPTGPLTPEDRDLGLDRPITRRDFLNATALGMGALLLDMPAPALLSAAQEEWHPWTGYAGVGDYARSNGNTWEVVQSAHALRDGRYAAPPAGAIDTGERYDLVVVGGGFSGLGAAYLAGVRGGAAWCWTTTRSSAGRPSGTSSWWRGCG
jgi:spermidine dehydrogenase